MECFGAKKYLFEEEKKHVEEKRGKIWRRNICFCGGEEEPRRKIFFAKEKKNGGRKGGK